MRPTSHRFRPSLVEVEQRHCPAASAVVAGHALYISTDPGSDAVLIRGDGAGHVWATVRGADGVTYARGSGIDQIFVHLRGSHDQLDFSLSGPPKHCFSVVVDAGRGEDNRLRFELPPDAGPVRGEIDLRGNPGRGGADVWVGRGGLGGVTVTNHMSGGGVRVHEPRFAPPPPLAPSFVRAPLV
jgi:hypothetical protein